MSTILFDEDEKMFSFISSDEENELFSKPKFDKDGKLITGDSMSNGWKNFKGNFQKAKHGYRLSKQGNQNVYNFGRNHGKALDMAGVGLVTSGVGALAGRAIARRRARAMGYDEEEVKRAGRKGMAIGATGGLAVGVGAGYGLHKANLGLGTALKHQASKGLDVRVSGTKEQKKAANERHDMRKELKTKNKMTRDPFYVKLGKSREEVADMMSKMSTKDRVAYRKKLYKKGLRFSDYTED